MSSWDNSQQTLDQKLKRIIKNIDTFFSIKSLVEDNIENNHAILEQLEKALLMMEFNQKYLEKFLKDGTLSDEDMLYFYSGEKIKEEYKKIEDEVVK